MPKAWSTIFKFNPVPELLSSGNKAIEYFTKRDILEKAVEPINYVWMLPEVRRIFQKQQVDGSWKHSGKETVTYPQHHYPLLQTWKTSRQLVERYEVNRESENARKAAEFLFSCQTDEGDIRGLLANQYATYYTGAIMALLIKSGYANDLRTQKALNWLLSMRQNDGGWSIPILTHPFDNKTLYNLTAKYAKPIEPDRSKPFSHNWTDMVLRAFAAHPNFRRCPEALAAAELLKSAFFQPDAYTSYQDAGYWVRFQFWWPNLVTALDTLSLIGYSKEELDIKKGLNWLIENQLSNGLWKLTYAKTPDEYVCARPKEDCLWLTLKIARIFKRFYSAA